MASTTTNLGLTKPELTDNITPVIFSENFDVIDAAITKINDAIKMVTVTLPAAGWTGSTAPFTQTITVPGMTADWIPGYTDMESSGNVTTDLAAREAFACVTLISSGSTSLTFTCYENKPAAAMTLRVRGSLEVE